MNMSEEMRAVVITCPKGLESLLLDEAQGLGLQETSASIASVKGYADLATAYRMCLWSRLGNRVLWVIQDSPLVHGDQLYETAMQIPWCEHFNVSNTFAVEFYGQCPGIDHSHYGALKVKDAIVDTFRHEFADRPSVERISPDVSVVVHWYRQRIIFSINLSGASLHQRGYRLQQGPAPLKENLAAALLIRAGWPMLAQKGYALVDPMCGSGTFLIEGAWMAAGVAPNLGRLKWGFSNWLGHNDSLWQSELQLAKEKANQGLMQPPLWIRGYESDPRLMQPARDNIARAGLSAWIKIYQGELATFEPKPDKGQKGLVVCNPPYGRRLGGIEDLPYLYQHLGESLKKHAVGWRAAVLSAEPQLISHMTLRAKKHYAVWNGAIPCRWSLFDLYDRPLTHDFVLQNQKNQSEVLKPIISDDTDTFFITDSRGSASVVVPHTEAAPPVKQVNLLDVTCVLQTKTPKKVTDKTSYVLVDEKMTTPKVMTMETFNLSEGAHMLANRLRKNWKLARNAAKKSQVNCYRLYDADMPEYAAAIDCYADWIHIQEYAAPKSIDPIKAKARLEELVKVTENVTQISHEHLVVKKRERQSGKQQYEKLDQTEVYVEVKEGPASLLVNLTDRLDSGLFLDHRLLRRKIFETTKGLRFLNLFCYTASITVMAALSGARETTSVDLSKTYLAWAKKNLSLNGLGERHRLIHADVLAWLETDEGHYDVIVLDPPTFSNSKRMNQIMDIQRDHIAMIDLCMARIAQGGVLYFSTHFKKFKMDENLISRYQVDNISAKTIDWDFLRHPRIHQTWAVRTRTL